MSEREQRATPLELFFDLVFVFGITQTTNLMSDDPTWGGLGRGLLVLAAIWWVWKGYAWLTNALEPELAVVRGAMVGAMVAMLVVALAVPHAFGEDAVLFGVAFLLARLLHLLLYVIAGRNDPRLLGYARRLVAPALTASSLLILAGFVDGAAQIGLWLLALTVDYLTPFVVRREGYRIQPAHFAERHGLIVIIALGESIVAIGIGASDLDLTVSVLAAGALGIVALAALWWAYFDVYAVMAERQLQSISGALRVRFARDFYAYLHLPMIAGVVLFALGLKKTVEHVGDPLDTVPAVALCGGAALFFFTHVVMRIQSVHMLRRTTGTDRAWFGVGRPVATVACLALIPAAMELPALASLALVTAVCCVLIVYDVLHYREERSEIRAARP